MPAPPKSLLNIGVSFLTTRTARKLRDGRAVPGDQEDARRRLFAEIGRTMHGRAAGIEPKTSYAQFQARTPLRGYEHFLPYIDRMKRGEEDVLWPGRCNFFAVTAGTAGRPKHLPVTDAMSVHFRQAGLASLLYYTARIGHAGVFRGRHLLLGGSAPPKAIDTVAGAAGGAQAFAGDLGAIATLNLPAWAEKHLYEPGGEIEQIADWPAKVKAIAERTVGRDVTLLAGMPNWLPVLADAVLNRAGSGKARPRHLQAVWPNLECLVHGGVPIAPFADELRTVLGPKVNLHEVYPASEAFVAAQDAESSLGLRVIADAGVFYEFLPFAQFDEANLAGLGANAVPLEGVRAGIDYVLLVTTPAGLCRYVVGDVVRFVTTDVPRLIYVGRTRLQLAAFGENVIEKEITEALVIVCQRHGWNIANFHVAPQLLSPTTGHTRGRHEWWIELRPLTLRNPTGPLMAEQLDAELRRLNPTYDARRKTGGLEAPLVRLVMPGVFEHWLRAKGRWGGQNKTPRCRSDREVADELAKIARFSTES